MIVKKVDKKKDRSLILEHKQKLCQQLNETDQHAFTLHLAVLIVFTTITGQIIHASGKFVSQIYTHLLQQPNISSELETLTKYHGKFLHFDEIKDSFQIIYPKRRRSFTAASIDARIRRAQSLN